MIAVGEGAQTARYKGHGAKACPGLAGCVGAGGVLFTVLTVTWGFKPMVRACKRHLHGCWKKQKSLKLLQDKHSFVCVLFSFVLGIQIFLCKVESQ